ncbi:MAG: AAA family ATPase [Sulfurovum sp.]|nr:AAA family ATPase [Sulfurovum sp.]
MIESLYLRNLVTFTEVTLDFEQGLVVLTGPSGAGKSVLMSAILASFGHSTQGVATLCEIRLDKPSSLKDASYIFEDEILIKTLKKEKLRYLLDGQTTSKKVLKNIFSPYVQYLSVRDKGGFDSESLLNILDKQLVSKDKVFKKLYKEYTARYAQFRERSLALKKIKEDESKLLELIEYARYEVEKIASIDPKIDEEASLLQVKQHLSRMDKIKDALSSATEIFTLETHVEEVYRLLDKDGTMFVEMMNQLRADFEETESLADELDGVDIEEVLDRLSALSTLKTRYGSIAQALEYKALKEKELLGYANISQDKSSLEAFLTLEETELMILARKMSQSRQKESKRLESALSPYLTSLKLSALTFDFLLAPLTPSGIDTLSVLLGNSQSHTLSGGEFNRVRLALMATTLVGKQSRQGVLILDEIDANVSGDESIAIAQMVQKLSSVYQVFAISHQPHLSAKAQQHLVVTKEGQTSQVTILDEAGRIAEIARIIAGENPTSEAIEFAKKLRS